METPNRYAPPASQVSDVVSQDDAPALWNPNAAANWSLLFSPVFGALVQMKNWQALGEAGRANTSKLWAIGSAIAVGIFVIISVLQSSTGEANSGRSFGLILLIVWYFANGRPQAKYVKERFGKDYPRRGWGKPLLIALGVFVGFVAVLMVIGVIAVIVFQK